MTPQRVLVQWARGRRSLPDFLVVLPSCSLPLLSVTPPFRRPSGRLGSRCLLCTLGFRGRRLVSFQRPMAPIYRSGDAIYRRVYSPSARILQLVTRSRSGRLASMFMLHFPLLDPSNIHCTPADFSRNSNHFEVSVVFHRVISGTEFRVSEMKVL
jgi:hypothetical protein